MERYAKKNTRERTWQETQRILNRDVLPAWKGRRIDSIHRKDVNALLDDIADKHAVHANRVLAAVRRTACSLGHASAIFWKLPLASA